MPGPNPDGWKSEKVRAYKDAREKPVGQKLNAYPYTSFRPRVENEPLYYMLRRWCDEPEVQVNISSLLNSLLPYLVRACTDTTERDANGDITVEMNFGRIKIK